MDSAPAGGSCRPPPPSRLRPCEHSALALLVAPLKNMLVSLSLGASLPFGSGGFCHVPWGAYPCASPARGVRAPKPAGRRLLACGGPGSRLLPSTLPGVTASLRLRPGHGSPTLPESRLPPPPSARGHSSNLCPGSRLPTAPPPRPGSRLLPHSPGVTASAPPSARGHGAGAARCSDARRRFPVLCPRPESWSRRRPRAGAGSSGR